jgi:hypothetical protein
VALYRASVSDASAGRDGAAVTIERSTPATPSRCAARQVRDLCRRRAYAACAQSRHARLTASRRRTDHGVWRSLVAHSLWERGATGSNPVTPTRWTTSAHKFACSHTSRSLCADHSACARAVRGGARAGSAGRGAERPAAEHQQHRGEPGIRPPRQLAPGNDGRAGAPRSVNCQDVELGLFRHAPQSDRSALSPRGLNFDPRVKRRWADGRTGG